MRSSMGDAQAAAEQQTLAVHQVGFGKRFGEPLGEALGALWVAAGVDEQGELVTTQTRQLVAGSQLRLQAGHHLEDQTVAGTVAEGVVGVVEVVQVEVAEGQTAPAGLGQTGGQQGLEALAVGDAGQRVLLSQALQAELQLHLLAHVAQATTQHVGTEAVAHQPVAGAQRRLAGFLVEKQDHRERATLRRRLEARGGQQQPLGMVVEQRAGRLP